MPYRIVIIADIHGILPSLEAVLADIDQDPPDEIIVAGDFLGGPQPLKTLAVLQQNACRLILGNGEANILKMRHGTAPEAWWTHRQFDVGRWIFQRLEENVLDFLEGLTEQCVVQPEACDPVRIVHGAPWDINKLVFPEKEPQVLDRALEMIPEDVLVFAHTHLPKMYKRNGKLAVNPGSVSNNLNGDTRASYATLTWMGHSWQPELHFVPYDLSQVVRVFKQTGFLEATRPLGRAFLESILTGENTALDYIIAAFDFAQRAGLEAIDAVPDDVWMAVEAFFPWHYDF
jgi:predicted phosphodiesterase